MNSSGPRAYLIGVNIGYNSFFNPGILKTANAAGAASAAGAAEAATTASRLPFLKWILGPLGVVGDLLTIYGYGRDVAPHLFPSLRVKNPEKYYSINYNVQKINKYRPHPFARSVVARRILLDPLKLAQPPDGVKLPK